MGWLLGSRIVLEDTTAPFLHDRISDSHVGDIAVHHLYILAGSDLHHAVANLLGASIQLLCQCSRRYQCVVIYRIRISYARSRIYHRWRGQIHVDAQQWCLR